MSASPLPRSLRITRRVTRGVLLAATAGTGVLGVHLAGAHHTGGTTAPAASRPTPSSATTSTTPSTTSAPATPRTTAAAPRPSTATAPRTTAAPAPRFTPVAPVAPAAGSGTGGGTTSGS